jgi:DNA-binding beta-propeller fold protein YncE
MKRILLLLCALAAFTGCATASIFPPIPLNLSPLTLVNPIALVADPAAQRLYLVNSNNTVLFSDASFIILDIANPTSPQAIAVISIPSFSGQILLDVPRGFVYLPNRLSEEDTDTVDQVLRININEASPTFLTVEAFESGSNPFGGFYDGTDSLFVACTFDALRYDVNSFLGFTNVDLSVTTAQGRALDASETRELALTPSGNFLFVTNQIDNMLILNVAQMPPPTTIGETNLGSEAVDYIVTGNVSTLGITRDSTYIYVVDGGIDALKIMTEAGLTPVTGPPQELSAASLQVASIPVGLDPQEVLVDEATGRAYVSNNASNDISVIDIGLQLEVNRIAVDENLPAGVPIGEGPFGMALVNIGGTNYLYVANFDSSNVTIIDANAGAVVGGFPL